MGQCGEYWGDGESGARGECRGAGDENGAAVRRGRGVEPTRGARKLIAVGAEGVKTIIRCLAGRRSAVRARRGSGAGAASAEEFCAERRGERLGCAASAGEMGTVRRAASAGARGMKTAQQYAGKERC